MRHSGDTESEDANTITILCTKCGKNESYLLEDLLPEIFVNWKEGIDMSSFAEIFAGMNNMEIHGEERE